MRFIWDVIPEDKVWESQETKTGEKVKLIRESIFKSLLWTTGLKFYCNVLRSIQNISQNNLPENITGGFIHWFLSYNGLKLSLRVLIQLHSCALFVWEPMRESLGVERRDFNLSCTGLKWKCCQQEVVCTPLVLSTTTAPEIWGAPRGYDMGATEASVTEF